jgi:hypothetical protein
MTVIARLTEIVAALTDLQLPYLVMGGQAVGYYGFQRETTDHDFYLPATAGAHLTEMLSRTVLFAGGLPVEAITWRGADFRRFVLGRLPDGKEELLEFWLHNHLLADFDTLWRRREEDWYAGCKMSFLALPDLIRCKETERKNDWQDISFLEEILDQRRLANLQSGGNAVAALAQLRSVRGLALAVSAGLLTDQQTAAQALRAAANPISQAFLLPFAPQVEPELPLDELFPAAFRKHLTQVAPSSSRHLAFVEAVRLRYKRAMQELDRREKEERRNR